MAPTPLRPHDRSSPAAPARPFTLGCVSYLNAKPLIHGVEAPDLPVRFDVPANLLDTLRSGQTDLALCPVIDAWRVEGGLDLVPVGGIACAGPTLTVRLFSRVPVEKVRRVHVDTDSHTSVALLTVLMRGLHGVDIERTPWRASRRGTALLDDAEAVLLIGDKVVTAPPAGEAFPHGFDLGEAWYRWTGLPFVFATWLARPGTALGEVPARLSAQRERNLADVPALVARYADAHGWPTALAQRYLGTVLRYRLGEPELAGVRRFVSLAAEAGLIEGPAREPTVRTT